MAVNYEVNYDDERFDQVEADKQTALNEVGEAYGGMINESDKFYQAQIDASQQWADKQSQLQQENTDFTIEQIEQQKQQAEKDYKKEQSGAYVDWQKQSNQYGAEAEKMASAGMTGTGFSESSQVSMYNTYQNRVVSARESYNRAVLNYDNAIKDARLQNNSILAEIAFNAQKEQLALSLEGFQYKNQLVLDQMNKKLEVDQMYYQRWQDVLGQINTENAMAEEIRQFDKNYELNMQQLDLQKKEFDESIRQFNQNYNLKIKEYNESIRQFNVEIERLKKKDAQEYELEIKNLELKKKQMEEDKRQFEAAQKLERDKLAEQKRQFDKQYAAQQAQIKKSSSSSSSSSSSKKTGNSSISAAKKAQVDKLVEDKAGSSGTPTNNMDSIIALGYGPISATYLASLISSGQVKRTLKNGQYYYTKNTSSSSNNRLKNMGLSW